MRADEVHSGTLSCQTATGIGTVIATGIVTGIVAIATGIAVAKCKGLRSDIGGRWASGIALCSVRLIDINKLQAVLGAFRVGQVVKSTQL